MSKARKQSGEKFDTGEIFADDDFDAEEFVEHMDDKGNHQQRPQQQARGGWRRLEELKEQKQLRSQLLELEDWDEF